MSHGFSIGGMHGWKGILLVLAGSVVFLLSGRQDLRLRARTGAMFGFFLAVFSVAGAIWLSLTSRVWVGTILSVAVLSWETWLIRRWWRKTLSS